MVWASYATEMRWHIIRDDLVELGLLAKPVQYLAFSKLWFCSCLLVFLTLLIGLRRGSKGLAVLVTIDGIFVLMLLIFGFRAAQLELPVLPLREQIRYIFRD